MKKTLTLFNIGSEAVEHIVGCGCCVKGLQRSKRNYVPYSVFNNPVEKQLYLNWIELTTETAQYFNGRCRDLNEAVKGWEITFEFEEGDLGRLRLNDELHYWLSDELLMEIEGNTPKGD